MRILNAIACIPLVLLSSCATLSIADNKSAFLKNPSYRFIVTTGLDETKKPISNLTQIPLESNEMYVFVQWNRIPNERFNYLCKIFDNSGQAVTESQMSFTPDTDGWNTWTKYKINKHIDLPGKWRAEIYLDNVLVVNESFSVVRSTDSSLFKDRIQRARALEHQPQPMAYMKKYLFPAMSSSLTRKLEDCLELPNANKDSFTLVADITQEGKMVDVDYSPPTNTAKCFATAFRLLELPRRATSDNAKLPILLEMKITD